MDPAPSQLAFLSIIAWPDDATRDDAVRLVAEHLSRPGTPPPHNALTVETLRLRVVIQPPLVLGLVDVPTARRVSETVRRAGGDAFAPTVQDLLDLGPTLKIRDLQLADGNFQASLWRGPDVTITPPSIQCLIRAHLSETATIRTPERARIAQLHFVAHMPPSTRRDFIQDAATRQLRTSDKLDLHTSDGRVFQIDGDKFGYRVLGDMKGYSDKDNMDRMFELFQYLATDAIPDMYYPLFKPPPGIERLRIPGAILNRDDPAFAFYSRWAALMYRHIIGTG